MSTSLPPLVEPAAELTRDEVARYSRHLIIPELGVDGQKRLKNARVLVIGAGGLGAPTLLYLAAAGVGTIGIVDFDVVDESNLQRQIIHGVSDVGRPKAQSARDSIAEVNPLVDVRLHEERLEPHNAVDAVRAVRPDPRRHRQLRHPISGQRRRGAGAQALRVGVDLPVRGPGLGVLGGRSRRARASTTATCTRKRRRRAWCRPAPKVACWASCARRSRR